MVGGGEPARAEAYFGNSEAESIPGSLCCISKLICPGLLLRAGLPCYAHASQANLDSSSSIGQHGLRLGHWGFLSSSTRQFLSCSPRSSLSRARPWTLWRDPVGESREEREEKRREEERQDEERRGEERREEERRNAWGVRRGEERREERRKEGTFGKLVFTIGRTQRERRRERGRGGAGDEEKERAEAHSCLCLSSPSPSRSAIDMHTEIETRK